MAEAASSSTRVPAAAKWLGALGAMPFVFLSGLGLVLQGPQQAQASFALAAYGAVILSFLGGIHWGLAISENGAERRRISSNRRLALSVVPSLVAWCALLLPDLATLPVLAASFAVMLAIDWRAARRGEAPPWYPKLRWPLTTAVVICLGLGGGRLSFGRD